ncbi:MAG: hypothetical protein VKP57_05410 [Candidatus Sericytochromatia bacterium]|nr:hypothetical protein [Candidatus Sericytochromatia bacterium]
METRFPREASPVSRGVPPVRATAPSEKAPVPAGLPADGLRLTGSRIDAARARKALETAIGASQGEERRIQSAIATLDPAGVSGAGDPVVRDLMVARDLLGQVRTSLGQARDSLDKPLAAIEAASRALDKHVAMYDTLKEARRNLHEGSYGRLGPAEEATLEEIDDAMRAAIFTQTRIVLAQDALENP